MTTLNMTTLSMTTTFTFKPRSVCAKSNGLSVPNFLYCAQCTYVHIPEINVCSNADKGDRLQYSNQSEALWGGMRSLYNDSNCMTCSSIKC